MKENKTKKKRENILVQEEQSNMIRTNDTTQRGKSEESALRRKTKEIPRKD